MLVGVQRIFEMTSLFYFVDALYTPAEPQLACGILQPFLQEARDSREHGPEKRAIECAPNHEL